MLGIAIRCIQHSQAMLECGVCELTHSFFHYICNAFLFINFFSEPMCLYIDNFDPHCREELAAHFLFAYFFWGEGGRGVA